MKPRTKSQFDVMARHKELPWLTQVMMEWAKMNVIEYKGFATKNRVVCLQCGQSFSPELVSRKKAVCPHCSTKINVEVSRKTTDKQTYYTAYAQIVGEYQVIRYFVHYCYFNAKHEANINCWEITQLWIKENGKYEIVSLNHYLTPYCETWTGDFEIRTQNRAYYSYYTGLKYDIYTEDFHPKSQIKGIYKKYGINTKLAGLTFLQAIRVIPGTPRLETLLKCKQYNLLNLFSSQRLSDRYWPAIKICIRNNYKVKDAKTWIDYVDLLLYFKKDIHNAKYVCPINLKKEHDRLVKKKRDIQRKQEAEQKRKQAQEWEVQFKALKGHLIGIVFYEDNLTIKTLDSVQEYLEEGDILHHCIFTNGYFLKKESICLSARIDDKPVETIELSLSKMKVVQCHGKFNQPSKHHDKIIEAVNKNASIFRKLYKKSKQLQIA